MAELKLTVGIDLAVSDDTADICCRLLELYLDAHPEKTISGCRTSRDGALRAEVKIQNKHDIG